MSKSRGKVLIVEDEEFYARAYRSRLEQHGYRTERAADTEGALALIEEFAPDILLLDLMLQQQDIEDGFAVLQAVIHSRPSTKVIVVTNSGSTAVAERALQLGAYDFIGKEERGYDELTFRVNQAYDRMQLERRIDELKEDEFDRVGGYRYGRDGIIVGRAAAMRQLYRQLDQIALTDATVLISGQSGTGKEPLAHALHAASSRAEHTMVVVNCGAIPAELIESELFGYVKGSRSAAASDRQGLFEAAAGSTLFLDEIGELPLALQAKLLRAIETREIRRVGDTHSRPVDLRLIAATNRNLEKEVTAGQFRQDLYFRLNTFVLEIPPLDQRREDIPLLATHFLDRYKGEYSKNILGFRPAALAFLQARDWPGNVRELENSIQRAVLFTAVDWIGIDDLEQSTRPGEAEADQTPARLMAAYEAALDGGDGDQTLLQLLARCEAALIRRTLAQNSSQQQTAHLLGITESGLRSKMDKYGIARVRATRE